MHAEVIVYGRKNTMWTHPTLWHNGMEFEIVTDANFLKPLQIFHFQNERSP